MRCSGRQKLPCAQHRLQAPLRAQQELHTEDGRVCLHPALSAYGFQQAALVNWCGAGMMDRRSAEQALHGAREAALRAITHAAYLAGAAGLDYNAPAGFSVDLQNVPKAGYHAPKARPEPGLL